MGGTEAQSMDYKDHCLRIGYIHTNLAALELALRFLLLKANKETFTSPKPEDTDAPVNHITNFKSLSWLIKEYNSKLDSSESTQFALDEEFCTHQRCARTRSSGCSDEQLSADIVEIRSAKIRPGFHRI